jgi:small subunit ribosomal protein S19
MVKKEFKYRGKTQEELKAMDISEFMKLIPSKERRALKRGYRPSGKTLMRKINAGEKEIKTHNREIIILPNMIGMQIKVYNGRDFEPVDIQPDMIGHRFGEFVMTTRSVKHTAPGIGATKSSANVGKK